MKWGDHDQLGYTWMWHGSLPHAALDRIYPDEMADTQLARVLWGPSRDLGRACHTLGVRWPLDTGDFPRNARTRFVGVLPRAGHLPGAGAMGGASMIWGEEDRA